MGYRDNRDIRDRGYEGDLIVPCDTKGNFYFPVSEQQALETMRTIIENDLTSINEYYIKLLQYELDSEKAVFETTFSDYTSAKFFDFVRSKIRDGFKFEHREAKDKYLTLEEFNSIVQKYMSLIYHRFSLYDINKGLEAKFSSMYEKYKDDLNWFMDINPTNRTKFRGTSSEYLGGLIQTCKSRLTEANNRIKRLKFNQLKNK